MRLNHPAHDALARDPALEVTGAGAVLRVTRRRSVPSRGLFRLLIPRAVVHVQLEPRKVAVRPDGLAWFMLVTCIGGVVVELTMDRVHYPREYPPAFIFGLAAFYVVTLAAELFQSRAAVLKALARAGG